MNSFEEIVATEKEYVMQTYKRLPVVIERGEGATLYDINGKSYIDFVAGIAVNALGHAHPAWVKAVSEQAAKLAHISNVVYSRSGINLAKKLVELSGLEKAFLCNSGTEAIEAAIKIARKWGKLKRGNDCFKIISFERGFHGRTLGALSATASEKYKAPFEPLVPGFVNIPLNDLQLLDNMLDSSVCAVIIETIQGEGGVWPIETSYLQAVRNLCDKREVLLIIDEIQTGIARTGRWFGFQHSQITPDIITLAKGLGGGFPIGAVLARGEAADIFEPGDHGSTYAGNPLACEAALSVIEVLEKENALPDISGKGNLLKEKLQELSDEFPEMISEVRGYGLMQALEFKLPVARKIVESGLAGGVFMNATSETTLRFVPPLLISEKEIKSGLKLLKSCIEKL